MKCRNCSKDIPEGFEECPWCGAALDAPREATIAPAAPTPTFPAATRKPAPAANIPRALPPLPPLEDSGGGVNVIFAIGSLLLSVVLVFVTKRTGGALEFGYAWDEHVGLLAWSYGKLYVISAFLVFAYFWFSKKRGSAAAKLLGTAGVASLLAVLTLGQGLLQQKRVQDLRPNRVAAMPRTTRPNDPMPAFKRASTKWDPAVRSIFTDLYAYNDAYIAEISKLDSGAPSLFSVDSFRDSVSIQQVLMGLRARSALSQKFADMGFLVGKMDGYIATVDASESEKQQFRVQFDSGLQKLIDLQKAGSANEQYWLRDAADFYQLAEANQKSYSIEDGRVVFHRKDLSAAFDSKAREAQASRQRFYGARAMFGSALAVSLRQFGLQISDVEQPAHSSRAAPQP